MAVLTKIVPEASEQPATGEKAERLAALQALKERIYNPEAALAIREKASRREKKPFDTEKFEAMIKDNPAFKDLHLLELPK